MKIQNATEINLEVGAGGENDEEPEVSGFIKSGQTRELPIEKFPVLVIKEG